MNGEEVLVPIAFFIFLGAVIIIALTSRHRERLAMIEKGLSSEEIKAMYMRDTKHNPLTSLKWGILFVFGGAAVLLGNYLHYQYQTDEGVMVGMVCLFAGIGLMLFYAIAAKKVSQG